MARYVERTAEGGVPGYIQRAAYTDVAGRRDVAVFNRRLRTGGSDCYLVSNREPAAIRNDVAGAGAEFAVDGRVIPDVQVVVYHSILCRHCARERTVLRAYVAGERAVDRADVAVSADVAGRVDGPGSVDIAVNAKRAVKFGGSVDFKPAKFSTACFERAELAETGGRHRSVFYHGVVARHSDFNLRPERTVCSGEVAGYVKIASDRRVAGYISCVGSEAACDRSAGVRRECAVKRRLSGYFEAVKFRVFVVRAEHGA